MRSVLIKSNAVRCVVVHLRSATESEVAAFLMQSYPSPQAPPWLFRQAGDPVLYIDFYRDMDAEFEAEDFRSLVDCLKGKPSTSVIANVSGRHYGDEEVRQFVDALLKAFDGIAHDEYTNHSWTREQVVEWSHGPGPSLLRLQRMAQRVEKGPG